MNQPYLNYATYNIWANNQLITNILTQNDALLYQTTVSSFPNLRATILHIWMAEAGWLNRLMAKDWDTAHITGFLGSNSELFIAWQKTSKEFESFTKIADLELEIPFEHEGQLFCVPSSEIILTVFNHGSYHRGQMVAQMRQLGITQIAQTDYIKWVRDTKGKKAN
jgi:uncharacterized damage-inducible protein DinB